MFDQKLVILVVLGVAIYLLTKPSSHSENKSPAPATATKEVVPSNQGTESATVDKFENFNNVERFGIPRQHLGVRDESQYEKYTVEDIVAAQEKETEQQIETKN